MSSITRKGDASQHRNGVSDGVHPKIEILPPIDSGGTHWDTIHADEVRLIQCLINNDRATQAAIAAGLERSHLRDEAARRFFDGATALDAQGERVTCDTLATWLEAQAEAEASGTEAQSLEEAAQIARGALARPPKGTPSSQEAERLARKLRQSAPKAFDFATLAQLKARPKPEWLVHRLLVKGDTSLLTAKHASFKSFFALDLALCVATDTPWHSYEVTCGPVVYVAAEGVTGLTKRAEAWCAHHDVDPGSNFKVLGVPVQVADTATREAFIAALGHIKPVLIVVDTLARCSVGLDENNAGDMGTFADALDILARATGAHVMTVHHNNKGGDYRGSSALPAAVGTHLCLERFDQTDAVILSVLKQKDAEELTPLTFEKAEIPLPFSGGTEHSLIFRRVETRTLSRFSLGRTEQKVLDELTGSIGDNGDGLTASSWEQICKQAGIEKRQFMRAKAMLLNCKAVVSDALDPETGKPLKGVKGARFSPAAEWEMVGDNSDKIGDTHHDTKTPNDT
jgi:hypothetical protein